ncbi:hypothetical protein ACRAWC_12260 [Leifsonia sp. L25]
MQSIAAAKSADWIPVALAGADTPTTPAITAAITTTATRSRHPPRRVTG